MDLTLFLLGKRKFALQRRVGIGCNPLARLQSPSGGSGSGLADTCEGGSRWDFLSEQLLRQHVICSDRWVSLWTSLNYLSDYSLIWIDNCRDWFGHIEVILSTLMVFSLILLIWYNYSEKKNDNLVQLFRKIVLIWYNYHFYRHLFIDITCLILYFQLWNSFKWFGGFPCMCVEESILFVWFQFDW